MLVIAYRARAVDYNMENYRHFIKIPYKLYKTAGVYTFEFSYLIYSIMRHKNFRPGCLNTEDVCSDIIYQSLYQIFYVDRATAKARIENMLGHFVQLQLISKLNGKYYLTSYAISFFEIKNQNVINRFLALPVNFFEAICRFCIKNSDENWDLKDIDKHLYKSLKSEILSIIFYALENTFKAENFGNNIKEFITRLQNISRDKLEELLNLNVAYKPNASSAPTSAARRMRLIFSMRKFQKLGLMHITKHCRQYSIKLSDFFLDIIKLAGTKLHDSYSTAITNNSKSTSLTKNLDANPLNASSTSAKQRQIKRSQPWQFWI